MSEKIEILDENELPREFIRGQQFKFIMELPCDVPEGYFAGWTPSSQLRQLDNTGPAGLIADLVVTWEDAIKRIKLVFSFAGDTSDWPLGPAVFDVLFTKDSDQTKKRSLPVQIKIVHGVTQ